MGVVWTMVCAEEPLHGLLAGPSRLAPEARPALPPGQYEGGGEGPYPVRDGGGSLPSREDRWSCPMLKRCSKCEELKDRLSFNENAAAKDGLQHWCSDCRSIDARRPEAMAASRERVRRYEGSEKARIKHKRYRQSEKGRTTGSRNAKKYKRNHPEVALAHQLVRNAIRRGELKRPIRCSECGRIGSVDAHHDNYSRPLHVRFLCRSCHLNHHEKTVGPIMPPDRS